MPSIFDYLRSNATRIFVIALLSMTFSAAGTGVLWYVLESQTKIEHKATTADKRAVVAKDKVVKVERRAKHNTRVAVQAQRRSIRIVQYLEGRRGSPGAPGKPGSPGQRGLQGLAGVTGATGATGEPGVTRAELEQAKREIMASLELAVSRTKGEKGDKGDKGDTGATGAPGGAGPIGPTGLPGNPFLPNFTLTSADGTQSTTCTDAGDNGQGGRNYVCTAPPPPAP